MFSSKAIERDGLPPGEYYALMLFALAGMMLMAVATDLLLIFLALEVFSLALYVLTGMRRQSPRAPRARSSTSCSAAFSSAFFLYGIAFTFGLVGQHPPRQGDGGRRRRRRSPATRCCSSRWGCCSSGFAFKVAAVPFHMWTPDAYEGAPTVVTGFMSTAVKAAAFAAFARVFLLALEPLRADWTPVLWVLAVCTMILGSVVGVAQTNLKRMLAYSSIAHGGYLLVALTAGDEVGRASILFYLVVLRGHQRRRLRRSRAARHARAADGEPRGLQRGCGTRSPVMAGLLTIFLLSLGGFPPMAGFVAKWYVFSAAVRAGQTSLAIIGVLTSVVSVFFYLRIVVMMYMTEQREAPAVPRTPGTALAALSLSVAVLLYLGVLPSRVLDLAARSVASMF